MDPTSEMNVGFGIDTSLLVFDRICQGNTEQCGTYYFNWKDGHTERLTVIRASRTKSENPSRKETLKQLSHLPRFDEYPVVEILNGKAVAPLFTRPEERGYRTTIRRGTPRDTVSKTGKLDIT